MNDHEPDIGEIITGMSDELTHPDRPFTGQPHTDQGERGKTMVVGLTMRDICDCFIHGICLASYGISPPGVYERATAGDGTLNYNDVYGWDLDQLDPLAVMQNMTCEIERRMGIYPNVPKAQFGGDIEETRRKDSP